MGRIEYSQKYEILINEIDTRDSVLDCLSDLNYGNKIRTIEIVEANNNFHQANRLREQLIKSQGLEFEISPQIQKPAEISYRKNIR